MKGESEIQSAIYSRCASGIDGGSFVAKEVCAMSSLKGNKVIAAREVVKSRNRCAPCGEFGGSVDGNCRAAAAS